MKKGQRKRAKDGYRSEAVCGSVCVRVDVDVERRCAIRSISFGLVSFDYGITNGQLELRS